jgi:dynein heavy chain
MAKSLKEVTTIAFNEYPKFKRVDWCVNRCGMAVLGINMAYWTFHAENHLNEQGNKGAIEYAKICSQQIEEVVKKVREKISDLDRCTLEALIVLDVHNKDVVEIELA